MKESYNTSYQYKKSVYYFSLILGGCLIFIFCVICINDPSEISFLMLALSLFSIVGNTINFLRFRIIVHDDRIEVHTVFKSMIIFWTEIGYIYDDTIWPYNKFGWIVWWIAPKAGVKKSRFALWGYCERAMELLSIIVEKSKPYANEVTPLVLQELEKWERKGKKKMGEL